MKKSNKRIWLGILILILLVISYIAFRYYAAKKEDPYHTFLKPRVEMTRFVVKKLTRESADMDMRVIIDNPLPVSVRMDSLQYKIYIGGVEVMKSTYPKNVNIKSNGNSEIVLPVFVKTKKLENVLLKLEKEKVDSTDYTISGSALISFLTFKDKPYEFTFTRRAPAYIIPKLVVEKIKVEKLRLKHSKILIKVTIVNSNNMAFDFKQTHYKMQMDKDHLIEGSLEEVVHIPARGKVTIDLISDLSLKEALEAGFDYLLNASNTDYSLYFETKIVSDNKSIKDSQFIMEATGKLKDLKK